MITFTDTVQPHFLLCTTDSEITAGLTTLLTQYSGWRVETSATHSAATDYLEHHYPALIVIDQTFDGCGFELCAELRRMRGYAEQPVLMLINDSCERTISRVRDCGATEFCLRDANDEALRFRIEQMLKHANIRRDTLRQIEEQDNRHNDTLTGLLNHKHFKLKLEQCLHQSGSDNRNGAVLLVDVDNFKRVNNSFDYQAGDFMLKAIARRMAAVIRDTDMIMRDACKYQPHQILGRIGGDEFIVFVDGVDNVSDIMTIANRMLAAISMPVVLDGHEVVLTASIGVALVSKDGITVDTLLRNAEQAMYAAKCEGDESVTFFNQQMESAARTRFLLESELRKAVELNQLFLHYQPIVDSKTGSTKGKILEAHGGILALDEIGELPLAMQTKLLRFVQEKHFTPVGSADVINVDVKIIAVTNRDLSEDVAQGLFRKDLFYRLNVVTLKIPALRERTEDIPLLANHFLNRFAMQFEGERKYLSNDALARMQQYSWPGNVRELENKLMQASILLEGAEIQWEDLDLHGDSRCAASTLHSGGLAHPTAVSGQTELQRPRSECGQENKYSDPIAVESHGEAISSSECLQHITLALREVVTETVNSHRFFDAAVGDWVDEEIIQQTYQQCQGNVKATAARLQMSLSTARRRINKILLSMEDNTRERPPSWPLLMNTLRPFTSGQCGLSNCFETIRMLLLKELLDADPGSMSQVAVIMGVSEPTLYKLKRKLPLVVSR